MAERLETHASRLLGAEVAYLDPGNAYFGALLRGHSNQQKSRRLQKKTIDERLRMLRVFHAFAEFRYPWQWSSNIFDEFIAHLRDKNLAIGTIRSYQGAIHGFVTYVRDPNYGWQDLLVKKFGSDCQQICHEGNMIVHASEYEGGTESRNFTYDEIERFFACADARIEAIIRNRRKGLSAAIRNSAMLKASYAWGPRRYALTMLNVDDFAVNPEQPRFGKYGRLLIRHGKAARGGAARRYTVLTIIEYDWVVKVIKQYVAEVRSKSKYHDKPAMFLTERGTRVSKQQIDAIFKEVREEAGLPEELTLHSLRHSFSTHMTEWGYARAFVQQQLGHEHPSTTSIYEHVSSDFKQHQIRRAIKRTMARRSEPANPGAPSL